MRHQNFIFIGLIISTLFLSSCSKDEPSLASTSWKLQFSDGNMKLSFLSDSTYLLVAKQGAIEILRVDGKYKYTDPTVQMTPNLFPLYEKLKGTISINKMKVVNDRTGTDLGEFLKEE